ncbi:hypothetical protein [Paludisphaera sp.]|uniref:hypothetical protein n=1 Tax=Paludisphaera sp. TaxID=2017432 RepID=UPI00301D9E28
MMNNPPPERPRIRFASWLAPAVLATWVAATPAMGAEPVVLEEVRVGLGDEGTFKIGAWTPIQAQIRAGDAPLKGLLNVVVADDDGVPAASRQAIDLPAGESRNFTAYSRIGTRDGSFSVEVRDESGRRLASRSRDQATGDAPKAIAPDDSWILALGRPQGVDMVGEVAGFRRTDGRASELVVTPLDASSDRTPERWLGYDGARVVVVDTADPEVAAMLAGPRGQALVDWARRGGHLVVSLGENWEAVRDSALGAVLPARPTGRERLQSLEALDTFANSSKPITPPGSPPRMVVRLEGVEDAGGRALAIGSGLPLVVRGPLGFGRVTLIAADVEDEAFARWTDRGLFWVQALDLKRDRFEEDHTASVGGATGSFYSSGVTDLASQLRVALEQFPTVQMVSFGVVAFLAFLYILAIGPGDYLFLKKVVGRMELTWITFPLIVATFTLLAYLAAYRMKGNELLVNKVDAIDLDQVSGLARGRSWTTLFSPQNRDYDLAFVPVAIDEPDAPPPVVDPKADALPEPEPGVEVTTSWFGVPEARFGGMGGSSNRFSFTGGGYAYAPVGDFQRLERVRIPIWSARTFSARWFGPARPVVESDLALSGFDRVAGTITNLQAYPLTDAVLAFEKRAYLLGNIAPGQTMRVELQSDRSLSGELKAREPNYMTGVPSGDGSTSTLDRGDLILAAMFHDAESRRTGQDQPLGNAVLRDLDLTGQLALQRPMLVARIDRPAARVAIGNAPNTPNVEQTTVLRVILPLKAPAASTR